MKFPSLFKTAKHSKFNYEPRYYDPIKEEIQRKLRIARQEQASEGESSQHTSSISAAFRRRERKSSQTSAIQLIIAVALLGTFVGWLFYGNDVFYAYLLLSPFYFYFRIKGMTKKQREAKE